MGLNIKNPEVESLAKEVAALMGANKTGVVRQALKEKKRLTRKDEDKILGYGER